MILCLPQTIWINLNHLTWWLLLECEKTFNQHNNFGILFCMLWIRTYYSLTDCFLDTVNSDILLFEHTVFRILYSRQVFDFGCSESLNALFLTTLSQNSSNKCPFDTHKYSMTDYCRALGTRVPSTLLLVTAQNKHE